LAAVLDRDLRLTLAS